VSAASLALIFGLLYLGLGMFGLIPTLLAPPPPDAPAVTLRMLYGHFLGLFPVNIVHDFFNIAIGLWALAAWADVVSAIRSMRSLAVLFAVLAVMGLIPLANTLFGVMPIYGHDVWLSALSAIAAAYVGYRSAAAARAAAADRRRTLEDRRHSAVPVAYERRHNSADRRAYTPRTFAAG
jgi:hypothetical protein